MRRDVMDYWGAAIRRSWMVLPVMFIWAVTASFNAKMGYEIGGGPDEFPLSLLYGAMFVALAALGAYGFAQYGHETGTRRAVLIGVGWLQLAVGLQAGFQSLGVTLSKGVAGMENKADQRKTAKSKLLAARAEFEKLPTPRSVASIEADEKLECAIKGKQYKDGVGPKCTQFRTELGNAKRYHELPGEIDKLTKELDDAPRVRDAGAQFEVASTFGSMVKSWWKGKPQQVTPDDVRFGWLVFLVIVLEMVGVFGFWLVGLHDDQHTSTGAGGRGTENFFGDVLGHEMALAGGMAGAFDGVAGAAATRTSDVPRKERPIPIGAMRQLPPPPKRAQLTGGPEIIQPQSGDASGTAAGGAATAHGSHFTFNIGGGLGARDGVTDIVPQPEPVRRGEAPAMPPRHDVGAVDDAPPVDRTAINEIADNLLAFRASCVVDVTGGHVTADNMYRRYVAWRGAGALGSDAFHALFASVSGLVVAEIAGQRHYQGVTLRAPALVAVG